MSKQTVPIEKICPVCNIVFPVCPPGKTSRTYPSNNQVFCSKNCAGDARYRTGTTCKELSQTEAAYIAGFIDADGSIFLYQRKTKYRLRVSFTNTKRDVLDWVLSATGLGAVVTFAQKNTKHSTVYNLQINADAAKSLLSQIEPYLIRKREQCRLAIDHQTGLQNINMITDKEWQRCNYDRMQALNRRGRQD